MDFWSTFNAYHQVLKVLEKFRSFGLQGAELWPLKEGKGKGCLKITAKGCITDTRPYGSLNSAM